MLDFFAVCIGPEDVTHAKPHPEAFLTAAERLGAALADRPARLIIALDNVPYMDSSGVATFVEAMQLARNSGSRLVLCGLQDRVRSVFEIARLDMVFTIVADADAAMSV